jgi:hypothetical protein
MTHDATPTETCPVERGPSKAARRRLWQRFLNITFISQAEEDARLADIERRARQPRERKRSISRAPT